MIEVVSAPEGGYMWRFISHEGRTLFESRETFPCITTAQKAALKLRKQFWGYAATIDHRMACCV